VNTMTWRILAYVIQLIIGIGITLGTYYFSTFTQSVDKITESLNSLNQKMAVVITEMSSDREAIKEFKHRTDVEFGKIDARINRLESRR